MKTRTARTARTAPDFLRVARAHCPDITTLEARNSDSLDFHWVAVWNLRAMISEVAPKLSQVRALAIVRAHAPEITSLETQNSDSRDFHSLPVWTIAAILRNAA